LPTIKAFRRAGCSSAGERVRSWADVGAEADEQGDEKRGRVGLGVRLDRRDDLAAQPVTSRSMKNRPRPL